jgi:hypothetical protein
MNLLTHLFIYNLAASVLLYGSLAYNPRMWLHRMPPEVRAKVAKKTPQERKLFLKLALPFLLLLFGYPLVYGIRESASLLTIFLTLCAFFVSFAVWDTLVLDLLIFCKITPGFIMIDGTDREDYSNMKYHLVSGSKGLILSVMFSGIIAVVLYVLKGMFT